MADAELLVHINDTAWTPERVLAGLLSHSRVELWRFSDDGPPATAPAVTHPIAGTNAVGWVTATTTDDLTGQASHKLRWTDDQKLHRSLVFGNIVEIAESDTRADVYADLDARDAAARRGLDAVAVSAANAIGADIFVTERAYLLCTPSPLIDTTPSLSPRDALAIVGLYLRSCGEYLIMKDPRFDSAERFNKGLYYGVGARELLPAGWGWFSSCVELDAGTTTTTGARSHELTYLAMAVFQRMTRALQSRDDLLRAMSLHQDNDVAVNACIAFDACLVNLMGALDAAARVANRLLCPHVKDRDAGWQKPDWLKHHIRPVAPGLADVFDRDGRRNTSTILSLLRNTMHGAGLPSSHLISGRRSFGQTLIRIPRDDEHRILAAVEGQGGMHQWGLRRLGFDELHADPAVFVGEVVSRSLGTSKRGLG